MAGNKLGIASETIAGQSAVTRLNGATFVDATQKLGDRADRLTAIALHSATEAALRKLDLIDFLPQVRTQSGLGEDELQEARSSRAPLVFELELYRVLEKRLVPPWGHDPAVFRLEPAHG